MEVDLRSNPDATAAIICVNASCATKLRSNSPAPAGLLVLPLEELPVELHEGEDFDLDISVLNSAGTAVASVSEKRNHERSDPCKCTGVYSYRQVDGRIEPA